MDDKSIKGNIARLRKMSGLSQTQIADLLGISRTAYRNLETGVTRMYNENIDRIAAVLEKSAEEVVLGYQPEEGDSRKLQDVRNEYISRRKIMEEECETKVADLRDQNNTLREYVEALKEIIRSKEEIIEILRSYERG